MFTFIKIALRNILRNTKRSLITVSAIGFGLGALIFIWSFVEGAHKQMIENYTSYLTSHILIHKKGYHEKSTLETYIKSPGPMLSGLKQDPRVAAASPRVRADGLLSSSESSAGILIYGVDPEPEKGVSRLSQLVKSGSFLRADSDKDIVIGASLAKNLNVGLGDKVVIMSQALDGSIAAGAFHILGLLDTGVEEIDKGVVLLPLKETQALFVMDDGISEIAVRLKTASQAEPIAHDLAKNLPSDKLEILPWQDVSPMMEQWIEFDNAFIWIIVIVVMIVVSIGILNTVLMGVLERTREFGILLALGTNHKQIIAMVAWESFFLGVVGSLAGLIIGSSLSLYFSKAGIDLSLFTSAMNSFYMDAFIYPVLHPGYVMISVILVLCTSMIVSIYPAWHAAHLKPVEAIRSI
ncbi:MAG: FtsX-like permease family protein [Candidatus Omnitrophota bacterium]|jgi:ABC-type lipoprotein release transport system permease subunit